MVFSAAEIKIEREKPIIIQWHGARRAGRSVAAVQLDAERTASVHRLARLA